MSKYFGVAYLKDGTIHLTKPHETQEECLNILYELKESEWGDRVESTTVIKRDMEKFPDGKIFGSPKSLDVMQQKRKKEK